MFACLLASILYIHISLTRSRLCYVLCALHGFVLRWLHLPLLGFVRMWPPVRYTSVVLVCLLYTFLYSMRCWYACLSCFAPPVWLSLLLCIFAHLPTCSCMSLCVVHTSIQWSYGQLIQNYIFPPRTPPFVWWHAFLPPLYSQHALFTSVWLSLVVCSLHPLPISFVCFFSCLLDCFFCLCMYTHGVRILGARVRLLKCKQKRQGCKQEDVSPQRATFNRLRGLAPPKRSSLIPSL